MRVLAVLAVFVCGCRCQVPTQGVGRAVLVAPLVLEFGSVPLDARAARTVDLTALTRAGVVVQAEVEAPFSVSPSVDVAGGETVGLPVVFAPSALGEVTTMLSVIAGDEEFHVTLHGVGVPACVSQTCQRSVFDAETGRCQSTHVAENEPCTAPCLDDGRCVQGTCVGAAAVCEDHDACTVDACGADGGCVNSPRVCVVEDPCRVAYCDPAAGCAGHAVEDGTPCGPSSCASASICLSGECRVQPRPNADEDCRYVELVTGGRHFCARTRGGGVRCWGSNDSDQQGRGFPAAVTSPGFLRGPSDITSVTANDYATCTASPTQGVRCVGPLSMPAMPGQRVSFPAEYRACVEGAGQTNCWSSWAQNASLTPLAVGQEPWCQGAYEACVITDGGVRCAGSAVLEPVQGLPPGPSAITCGDPDAYSACARYADGAVWCWLRAGEPVVLADAGVSVVGQSNSGHTRHGYATCTSGPAGTQCIRSHTIVREQVPWADVMQFALGDNAQCALHSDGRVSCLGENHEGGLGDRSFQPAEPQRWAERVAKLDLAFSSVVLLDGGMASLSSEVVTDGGFRWTRQALIRFDGGVGKQAAGWVAGGGFEACWLNEAHQLWCKDLGAVRLQRAGVQRLLSDDFQLCLVADAGLECWDSQSPQWRSVSATVDLLQLREGSQGCFTVADGGWWCLPGHPEPWWRDQPTHDACGTCALTTTGVVRCLDAGVPQTVPGVWFAARGITCGTAHTCWWGAINGVQCVGENREGQLGHDGPASARPVAVPMDEEVVSVTAGGNSTCAVLASGAVRCWGANLRGQLGAPFLENSEGPVDVTQ